MTMRKATDLNLRNAKRLGTPAFIGSVIGVGILVVAGAIFVGKSDQGVIDVTAAIQSSNQTNAEDGDSSNNLNTIPEAFRNVPNGGLVATESQDVPPPALEVTETTSTIASTTDTMNTPETSAESETQDSDTPSEPIAENAEAL